MFLYSAYSALGSVTFLAPSGVVSSGKGKYSLKIMRLPLKATRPITVSYTHLTLPTN